MQILFSLIEHALSIAASTVTLLMFLDALLKIHNNTKKK